MEMTLDSSDVEESKIKSTTAAQRAIDPIWTT